MNNKTPKNLIAVVILAVMLFGAQNALAYVPGVWDPQPRIVNNEPAFTVVPMPVNKPLVIETQSTLSKPVTTDSNVTTNSTTNSTGTNSTTKNATTSTTKNSTSTSNKTTSNNTSSSSNQNSASNLPPVVIDQGASGFSNNAGTNGLTALSLKGSGGFMPSSIWQWIFVVILILIVIIIARSFKRHDNTHVAVY